MLGWGAALGLLAPNASAATSQGRPVHHNSVATATTGGVSVPDVPNSALSVTAVAKPDVANSPQRTHLGSDKVLSALQSVPGPGAALAAALKAANPTGTQLSELEATAVSQSGTSTACASLLSADCAPGQARPEVLRLGLSGLTAGLSALTHSSVARQLPDPLANYSVVLTIAGPQATCSAGPTGSGQFSAASSLADATVDLQDNGRSVLPAGAAPLTDGSVFTTLQHAIKSSPLNAVLSAVTAATPLTVTLSPGSHSESGSTATASTGQVTFTSGTVPLLDIRAATVTCGPNTTVSDPYVSHTYDGVAGTGTPEAPTSSLTSDLPALQGLTG